MKKWLLVVFCFSSLLVGEEVRQAKEHRYQLAVCTIFQNEARFLREWIEFHKLVGVEHFYLFNNLSQDDYLAELAPYIESGEVELTEWPKKVHPELFCRDVQVPAYNQTLKKAKKEADWLAIIDIDEFLVPVEEDTIPAVLKDYEQFGGVCANWQMFGSSWVERIPDDQLMIETLLLRAPQEDYHHKAFKSIVRPDRVLKMRDSHAALFHRPYYAVDTDRKKKRFGGRCAVDKIRVHHYWSRDEEFFYSVKVPRHEEWQSLSSWGGTLEESEKRMESFNKVVDETMLRFVPALRERMGLPAYLPMQN